MKDLAEFLGIFEISEEELVNRKVNLSDETGSNHSYIFKPTNNLDVIAENQENPEDSEVRTEKTISRASSEKEVKIDLKKTEQKRIPRYKNEVEKNRKSSLMSPESNSVLISRNIKQPEKNYTRT